MHTRIGRQARALTDGEVVEALRRYVDSCCESERPPRINEFAQLLGIHRRRVGEATHRATGTPAIRYVRILQIEAAIGMIHDGLPLKQIAYRAGFGTRRPFFRSFKTITGVTPRTYRKRHHATRRQTDVPPSRNSR